tara:strand:+ start:218 stop:742 length:525 start_codon:yes stop_codon:yes gene_type:complete
MSRNIFLSIDEWQQIREELKVKKRRCEITRRMEDEYWNFRLFPIEIKEWKSNAKKYPHNTTRCFPRTGVNSETLDKIKTPRLFNRLLQENYRSQDLGYRSMFPSSYDGGSVRSFISWATNTTVFDDKDLDRTIEEWERIRIIMGKKMDLSNKTRWYHYDLEDLFEEVVNNVTVS